MSETMKYVRHGLLVGASTLVFLSQVSVAQDTAAVTPPPADADQKQPEIVVVGSRIENAKIAEAFTLWKLLVAIILIFIFIVY
jgi:hypothetical protein